MKKGFIAILMALASFTAYAQRPDTTMTAEQRAENQTKKLTERLGLSEDQQKQIYTLNLERSKKMEELRDSRSRGREEMKASMEKFNTDLAKILTPEQAEKYKEIKASRHGAHGGERRKSN